MVIIAHLSRNGCPLADITYRSGMHVEVRVAQECQTEQVDVPLCHSPNGSLRGTWEESLDQYFNEGQFDSKEFVFPGEMRRVGAAREHKSLFRHATMCLWKDLESLGCRIDVEFI